MTVRARWSGSFCLMVAAGMMAAGMAAGGAGLGREDCAATRRILSAAISARRAGEGAAAVKARLGRKGAVPEKYRATVPPLVDLAFTIDPSRLGEAVAAQYEAQCLGFDN